MKQENIAVRMKPHIQFPRKLRARRVHVAIGQLVEEQWEARRFHLWYMEVKKAGLHSFSVHVLKEALLLDDDIEIFIDFHNMHRLLRPKDLVISQVILFTLLVNYELLVYMHRYF